MTRLRTTCICLTILALPGCRGCREQRARVSLAAKPGSAQPNNPSAPSRLYFHGLSLAGAPHTNRPGDLPDLWLELPKGSGFFEIRREVKCVYSGLDGTVYYNPWKNRFYIQRDPLGSSTMTYYGPFEGDPNEVLKLDKKANIQSDPVGDT